MHGRDRPAWLWIGCLLVGTMARPASAQDPQAAGEHTDLARQREARCASLNETERRKTEACKTDEERREDEYEERLKAREEKERPTRSSFLRWVHTDGLWIPTESGNPTFGLIGVHVAVAKVGRLHIYGPPGVIVLRQRTQHGWMFRPGFTWGVSIYLTDVRFPGTSRAALLFANLTKCWTHGDQRNGMSMAGLSVTWKK
jgi:hypothetical protein